MFDRSPVRWLGPIVLVGAVALIVWVTSSTLSDKSSGRHSSEVAPAASATHDRTPPTTKTPSSPSYTVRSGDFLTTVSEKTGVSLDRLRALNPKLDANALRVGQKIRLVAAAAR